jgi:hypothetical protein
MKGGEGAWVVGDRAMAIKDLLDRLHSGSDLDGMEWFGFTAASGSIFGWNAWNLSQHLMHGRIYVFDKGNQHWAYWSVEPRPAAILSAQVLIVSSGAILAALAIMAVLRVARGRPAKPHEAMPPANLDHL